MDQGQHHKQSDFSSQQPFFTTGAGTNSDNINDFESENNLDLSNQATDWRLSREENPQGVGNKVIDVSDRFENKTANTLETPHASSETPEEEPLDPNLMPPSDDQNQSPASPGESSTPENLSLDSLQIKTTETLNKGAIKKIDAANAELDKTGDISNFYEQVRYEFMPDNLENSYGRKLEDAA